MSGCICCGENTWRTKHRLPAFLFGKEAEIRVCINCGLGKTFPELSVSSDFYADNEKYDSLFIQNEELYKKFAKSLLGLIGAQTPSSGKRLLDVGCGGGFLVQEANTMGYDASGIDANKHIVEWAAHRGIPIEQGDIGQKLSNHEKYDVIVLSAVLEHLPNPSKLILDCKKLLNHSGMIVVSQASCDGLLPRVFPWGWYGWQPQEHFWHFTPESFAKLAASCGLRISQCTRNSLYHRYYFSGGLKTIIGRNLATIIARFGNMIGQGDNFDCIIVAET